MSHVEWIMARGLTFATSPEAQVTSLVVCSCSEVTTVTLQVSVQA